MARASRNVRKLRRIKRERTIALNLAASYKNGMDQARMVAYALEQELRRRDTADKDLLEDNSEPKTPTVTITRFPEETEPVG